ncbi:ACT domain-containing protein [Phlyctochytrium arcticum]|nr:ACT domain-containing protein [Phlyctochytrium arcticum]
MDVDSTNDEPASQTKLTLIYHPTPLSVHRLSPSPVNLAATSHLLLHPPTDTLISLTITPSELSLVLPTSIPLTAFTSKDLENAEHGWVAFRVRGVLDFGMVGVMANLSRGLASAKVSVFVISTFDTDWVLVKEEKANDAANIWRGDGFSVIMEASDRDIGL